LACWDHSQDLLESIPYFLGSANISPINILKYTEVFLRYQFEGKEKFIYLTVEEIAE